MATRDHSAGVMGQTQDVREVSHYCKDNTFFILLCMLSKHCFAKKINQYSFLAGQVFAFSGQLHKKNKHPSQSQIDEMNILHFDPGTSPIPMQKDQRLRPFAHFVNPQKRVFNRRRLSFAYLPRASSTRPNPPATLLYHYR